MTIAPPDADQAPPVLSLWPSRKAADSRRDWPSDDWQDMSGDPETEQALQRHDEEAEATDSEPVTDGTGNDPTTGKQPSAAARLLALARERYEAVLDTTGVPYAVPVAGPNVAVPLLTSGFRALLAASFEEAYHALAGSTAINNVVAVMHGWANSEEPIELPLRSVPTEDGIILDRGTTDGKCIALTAEGWKRKSRSLVTFRRTKLTDPLPTPVHGGSLARLREVVNISDEAWPLLLAWQVNQLLGRETPIATFTGEAGAGKSTAARIMVMLTDPSSADLRSAPRDEENWVVSAAGSRIVGIDNINRISVWFSDSLCRAVTGDGSVRRERYSDSELVVIKLRRAVVLTGIHLGTIKSDLAERLLPLELEPISPTDRLSDLDVQQQWTAMHAEVLGGLLDLTVKVLEELPRTRSAMTERPRMASFAEVVRTVDVVLGTSGLPTYLDLLQSLKADVIDGDLVAQAIIKLARDDGEWEGTGPELLEKITPEHPARDWPANSAELARRVNGVLSVLRDNDIEVTKARTNSKRLYRLVDLDYDNHRPDVEDPDLADDEDPDSP